MNDNGDNGELADEQARIERVGQQIIKACEAEQLSEPQVLLAISSLLVGFFASIECQDCRSLMRNNFRKMLREMLMDSDRLARSKDSTVICEMGGVH